jgi:hypothetical protein
MWENMFVCRFWPAFCDDAFGTTADVSFLTRVSLVGFFLGTSSWRVATGGRETSRLLTAASSYLSSSWSSDESESLGF